MKKNIALIMLIAAIVIGSCSNNFAGKGKSTVVATRLEFGSSEDIIRIDWLPKVGLVAFLANSDESIYGYRKENDSTVYPLNLPQDLPCTKGTDYAYLGYLPDGRLGFTKYCRRSENFPNENSSYLVAYDLLENEVQPLVKDPLPYYASEFSWNPDMTRGVQQIYQSLAGTIYWITPEGSAPMNVLVGDDKGSWSLARDYPDWANDNNKGIAAYPAWSPDGSVIAFFASTDAIGRDGLSRVNSEFKMYFMDPEVQKPTSVLEGIYHPMHLKWSPNGKWLVFIGETGLPKNYGIWIYFPETDKTKFVASGDFRDIVWSPKGNTIVSMLCLQRVEVDPSCANAEFWQYDVDLQ